MIGLYAKIPFHAQLKRSDDTLGKELEATAREASSSFGAVLYPLEESIFLCFDESAYPCRLRAAEASRFLVSRLKAFSPRLHGWAIILVTGCGAPDEALRAAKRLWFGIKDDGLFLGPGAPELFSPYFRVQPEPRGPAASPGACLRAVEAPYAARALPVEGSLPLLDDRAAERLVEAIGDQAESRSGSDCLAVIGPGSSSREQIEASLELLYKRESAGFLRLRASVAGSSPYGPLAEALARLAPPAAGLDPERFLSAEQAAILAELAPMLDCIKRSPYRSCYTATFGILLRLRAAEALRLYARERRSRSLPAFVILENAERFSAESIGALFDMLAAGLGAEGISILAFGSALPASWPPIPTLRATIPGASALSIAKAAREGADASGSPFLAPELAAAAAGDPFRLRLAQRLVMSGRPLDRAMATAELAARAVATLPSEYAGFLFALRLCEGALDPGETEDFLDSIGFVSGLRPLIRGALAELGLVEPGFAGPGSPSRIARADAAAAVETALSDGGAYIAEAFASRLLALRAKRRILPSSDLYREIAAVIGERWGRYGNARLALDCCFADRLYGGADRDIEGGLASLGPFFGAYADGDGDRAAALLSKLEAGAAVLAASGPPTPAEAADASVLHGSISLAKAALDYAARAPQAAAAKAKAALMELHAQDVPASEARALRILGLCALAQGQVQEAADYLSNAFEAADALPEPLECILAAGAEASAHFLLGNLGRARSRARSAAAWARRSFRADWEAAAAFIEGRIALELGDCRAAEEAFRRVRSQALVHGRADAALRAEIWTGRAAAWAGEIDRARGLLSPRAEDPEALWFLGELEYREGRRAEARACLERAAALIAARPYPSADSFSWRSGFEALEEMGVGFGADRSYLEDQILAFRDFASGMADAPGEGRHRAELLALRAREDRLAELHPAVHLYHFYRCLVLDECAPASMDGAAALSKAFKGLQTRTAKIDDAQLKDSAMFGNPWNRLLLAEARARKLI